MAAIIRDKTGIIRSTVVIIIFEPIFIRYRPKCIRTKIPEPAMSRYLAIGAALLALSAFASAAEARVPGGPAAPTSLSRADTRGPSSIGSMRTFSADSRMTSPLEEADRRRSGRGGRSAEKDAEGSADQPDRRWIEWRDLLGASLPSPSWSRGAGLRQQRAAARLQRPPRRLLIAAQASLARALSFRKGRTARIAAQRQCICGLEGDLP